MDAGSEECSRVGFLVGFVFGGNWTEALDFGYDVASAAKMDCPWFAAFGGGFIEVETGEVGR